MEESNDASKNEENNWSPKDILNYKNKGSQTVVRFLGIELTAPEGLKNPGIVYLSFIVVNIFIFFVLRSFVAG